MRTLAVSLVVLAALVGGVLAVAAAAPAPEGLPAYTKGYAWWKKLNRRTITTPGAHTGAKQVYASVARVGRLYPDGAVIVKTISVPGSKGLPRQVAVMRKVNGAWRWVEYQLAGTRSYDVLARGSLCTSCHMQAKANDWVFTRG